MCFTVVNESINLCIALSHAFKNVLNYEWTESWREALSDKERKAKMTVEIARARQRRPGLNPPGRRRRKKNP